MNQPITEDPPAHDAPIDEELQRNMDDQLPRDSEPVLQPQLDERWALNPIQLACVAFLGGIFLLFSYLPLRATDLWCHVAYGHWILEHRQLPTEDPFMPLAKGVPIMDSWWLSQINFAGVDQRWGAAGLSTMFALLSLLTFVVLMRTLYLVAGGRLGAALVGSGLALVLLWSRLGTIRPESFGLLLMTLLMWLLVAWERLDANPTRRKWFQSFHWIGLVLIFACWANIHGSFVCGVAVLGCVSLGRAVEVIWQERRGMALVHDRLFRRWVYATELAVVASLINPFGLDLWVHAFTFSSHPNLRAILEWQPLQILGPGGRAFALSWPLLVILLRFSRRRVPPAHVALLALFSVAAIVHMRMLTWFGLAYVIVAVPHLADIADRWSTWRRRTEPEAEQPEAERPAWLQSSWKTSLIALLVIWLAFSLSPASQPLIGGKPRTPEQLYGATTPLSLSAYLRDNPVEGQVFNPQYWGDWLVRDGQPDLRVLVTSNIHSIPPRVWQDYLQLIAVQQGWEGILDRYRINTVIVDKQEQSLLGNTLLTNAEWEVRYEDAGSVVFERKRSATAGERS